MRANIKRYILPLAIVVGILAYREIEPLSVVLPYIIMTLLLVPFCKIPLQAIRVRIQHVKLVSIQVISSLLLYFCILPIDRAIAQAVFIILFTPAAASSSVVVSMLNGNTTSILTYTIFSSIVIALLSPIILSLVGSADTYSYAATIVEIVHQMTLLIIVPFILSLLLRRYTPKLTKSILKISSLSLYLWTIGLVIVMARATSVIIELYNQNSTNIVVIPTITLVLCILQFIVGGAVGERHNDKIASTQALGQKNTILAVWITLSYLLPEVILAPVSYIVFQNIINTVQLVRKKG